MEVTYDPRYNVGYIRFTDPVAEVDAIKICDSLNIDLSRDGKVVGIELLDATRQFGDDGLLTFVNEASGNRQAVPTG